MTSCTRLLWLIILPFVLFLNSAHADTSVTDVEARIINGVDADAGEHDYFVALLYEFQWANGSNYWTFCGGTHLGNGTIVTAAHCVDGTSSTPLYVLIGNNSADMADEYCLADGNSGDADYCKTVSDGEINNDPAYVDTGYVVYTGDEGNLYSVTLGDFVVHQAYSSTTLRNDIALLQLDSSPSNSALILPRSDQYETLAASAVENSVMVVGHGDIISDDLSTTFDGSPALLEATLTPKTDTFCASVFPTVFDGTTMVCAGETGVAIQDSCQGDSGGPLFDPTTSILLGIVSFGPSQCAALSAPYAVYTNVYQYVDWIESGGVATLAFEDGKETIRLGNLGGAFGLLGLILLPLMFFRKLK